MEAAFGTSFDGVRVHVGNEASALGASAFTCGSKIFFAPGQYNPLTQQGQRLLGHELAHVVQQRAGRVSNPFGGGLALVQDRSLEAEAERMSLRASAVQLAAPPVRDKAAIQRAVPAKVMPDRPAARRLSTLLIQAKLVPGAGNGNRRGPMGVSIRVGPLAGGRPRPAIPSGGTIQRKVGFEFEIDAIRTQYWQWFGNYWMPDRKWVAHQKGSVIARRTGYDITSDEAGANQSRLEIIIKPIDETSTSEVNTLLTQTVPDIVNVIDSIAEKSYNKWSQADQIPKLNGSSYHRFKSSGSEASDVNGQLQLTAGVALKRLPKFLSGEQAEDYLGTLDTKIEANQGMYTVLGNYLADQAGPFWKQARQEIDNHNAFNGLTLKQRDQLAAVVDLMATIPLNARSTELDYPKAAAGNLLARTDFSAILAALPDPVKAVLTPSNMRTLVLDTMSVALKKTVLGTEHVFPTTTQFPVDAPKFANLTLNQWIGSVVPTPGKWWGYWQGKDYLTKKNFPGTKKQKHWIESLGGYGSKFDPGNKPIFEFRTLHKVNTGDLGDVLERLIGYLNH
jgi:hypothetical protein